MREAAKIVMRGAVFAGLALVAGACDGSQKAGTDTAILKADSVKEATLDKTRLPSEAPPVKVPVPASTPAPPGATGASRTTTTPPVAGVPHLISLKPSSATISPGTPVLVEISGTGFTPTGNTIYFGSVPFANINSPNGRSITLTIPETLPSRGEVPPMRVVGGEYRIHVANAKGSSNTLTFTLRDQDNDLR